MLGFPIREITARSRGIGERYPRSEANLGGDPERVKKRKRPLRSTGGSGIPDAPLTDGEIPRSILHLSLDKWAPHKRFVEDRLGTWGAQGAVN